MAWSNAAVVLWQRWRCHAAALLTSWKHDGYTHLALELDRVAGNLTVPIAVIPKAGLEGAGAATWPIDSDAAREILTSFLGRGFQFQMGGSPAEPVVVGQLRAALANQVLPVKGHHILFESCELVNGMVEVVFVGQNGYRLGKKSGFRLTLATAETVRTDPTTFLAHCGAELSADLDAMEKLS